MWAPWKSRTWSNKKIAFVAILIATSVAFILIFARTAPITALPSMKLMAGGLPIKITGYIFGPLVGLITGLIADLLSFAIFPTIDHWWYVLAFALAGTVPGLVAYFMHRRWKNREANIPSDAHKVNNINFILTLAILVVVAAAIVIFTMMQSEETFAQGGLIKNKFVFLGVSLFGLSTMLIGTIVFRFIFKPKTFNALLPIIAFSAILEVATTPLITLGDMAAFDLHKSFITLLTAHFLLSPVKIWLNLIIIFFSYKIVAPLIFNKTGNGWDGKETKQKEEIRKEEK